MFPKAGEGAHVRKTTGSPSKGSLRICAKKPEGANLKEKVVIRTNVRRSTTLMNLKPETAPKKTTDRKKKTERAQSATEGKTPPQKDPGIDILEHLAQNSKINVDTPPKYPFRNEPSTLKTEYNKYRLKGFTKILPLCEKELKKVEAAWMNTVYCSLSMRANLVKFLIQSFPNIEKSQFYTEDKKLLQFFDQVRVATKAEADNLLDLVKSLLAICEETKENYQNLMKSDKALRRKLIQTGENCKIFKVEFEAQKKKDGAETPEIEKPQKTDKLIKKKESPLLYFSFGGQHAANILKQNEKGNTPPIAEESIEMKPEAVKLASLQDNLNALKAKYSYENETYEKKIKDLETLLEEKIRILRQEREMKNQLQTCLNQFQAQQKRLSKTLGNEQVDYLIRQSSQGRDKRREDLWLTAIKLILKGFFVQLKNLETERDKMLYQLQSNDVENFNILVASIIHKDNFVKSIRQQMMSINKAYMRRKYKEN